jgi:hypothetical protein
MDRLFLLEIEGDGGTSSPMSMTAAMTATMAHRHGRRGRRFRCSEQRHDILLQGLGYDKVIRQFITILKRFYPTLKQRSNNIHKKH